MTGFKQPVSVLVVIHTLAGEVLLLERARHPGFWQSVTGSRENGESARTTAWREVREETGLDPVLSTSGGTSDARFVKDHCPVLEFGLVGHFMHQVDERVPADQVRQLARIYRRILERYLA